MNYSRPQRNETGSVRDLAAMVAFRAVHDVKNYPSTPAGKEARRWLHAGGYGLLDALDLNVQQVVAAIETPTPRRKRRPRPTPRQT